MARKSPTVRTMRRRLQFVDGFASPSIPAAALDQHLPALTRLIEDATITTTRPQIIRVLSAGVSGDGVEVGLRDLDERDGNVVDALVGFTAPPDWLAVGVVTGANAWHLDRPDGEPSRAHTAHLVTRSGAAASVIRLAGEEPVLIGGDDSGPIVGRIDDACRRVLDLPTPPGPPVAEMWSVLWLGAVLEADPAPASWEAVARLHPAFGAGDGEIMAVFGHRPTRHLVELGHVMAKTLDWPVLRVACGAGQLGWHDIPPQVARWLDDGAFARWALWFFPPLPELLTAVEARVSPAITRRIHAALHAWRVDGSGWRGQ